MTEIEERGFSKTKETMLDRRIGTIYGGQVTATGRRKLGIHLFNLKGLKDIQLFALESKTKSDVWEIYRSDMAYKELFEPNKFLRKEAAKKDTKTKDSAQLYPP